MENMTKHEASKYLRISTKTLERRIKDGTIKAAKIGARVILRRSEIEKLIDKSIVEGVKSNADSRNDTD